MSDEFYLWARDTDHALELAGHGATEEFDNEQEAKDARDEENHSGWRIFRVCVTEVDGTLSYTEEPKNSGMDTGAGVL